MWRRLDQVPPSDEVLLWLYGVARNVVRNYQRGARRYLRLVARVGSLRAPFPEEPAPQVIRSLEQARHIRVRTDRPSVTSVELRRRQGGVDPLFRQRPETLGPLARPRRRAGEEPPLPRDPAPDVLHQYRGPEED